MMKAALLLLCFTALAVCSNDTDDREAMKKGSYDRRKTNKMAINASDTLGEEMFEVEKDGDKSKKVSFGMFKIVEQNSSNKDVADVHHVCNFRKMNIKCTKNSTEGIVLDGLDKDGESVDVRAMRVKRRCDLSACNNGTASGNATLVLYTDIFDVGADGAYTCQPNCTTNDNSTFQTPVMNGTIKWSVRMENWNFTSAGTQLKFVFKVRGKNKGDNKFREPKKKSHRPLDTASKASAYKLKKYCAKLREKMEADRADKKRDMSDKNNWKDDSKDWKEFKDKKDNENKPYVRPANKDKNKNKNKNNNQRSKSQTVKSSSSKRKVIDNKKTKPGDKSGWGICRNAKTAGPGGRPDDQENYKFGDVTDDNSTSAVFRMMGMAVIDNATVADDTTGFKGPIDHDENDDNGRKIKGLISITVPVFDSSVEYDPTVDIEVTGGNGDSGSSHLVPFFSLIALLAAYLMA